MRTFLFLTALGGSAWYAHNMMIPGINVQSVDWLNQKVIVVVRFKEIAIDAGQIFRTFSALDSPIRFSRYRLIAQRNQFNEGAPNVLRISITDGNTIYGQSVFIDFDEQNITPAQ